MNKKLIFFVLAIIFGSFLLHCEDKFTLDVRVKNLSDNPAAYLFKVSRCMSDFNGYKDWDFLPLLGYTSKKGLSSEKPSQEIWLSKNEETGWMKMPAYGKVIYIYNESNSSPFSEIEIRVKNKQQDISRLFLWKDRPKIFHIYLYYFPETAKPPLLTLKTTDEFIEETIQYICTEMKNFPLRKKQNLLHFQQILVAMRMLNQNG